MSSTSTSSRNRRLARIFANPLFPPYPCENCAKTNSCCVVIADFSIMSCAKCTRNGNSCVSTSLVRLDRVVDELSEKIVRDEKDAERITAQALALLRRVDEIRHRIERNRKVRDENNKKVEEQVRHLAANTEFDPNDPELSDFPGLENDLLEAGVASPFSWPDGHPSSSNQEAAV